MSHEHETLDAEPANAVTEPTPTPRSEAEPDFITRARRIFRGDIRPDDYTPVPPEVQAAVDSCHTPEHAAKFWVARQNTLNDWTLSFLYGEIGPVFCRETEQGVIVIAVGLERIRAILDHFPHREQRTGFSHTHAFPWQSPGLMR